jgi:septal ring factor EnvC (AmiA/AmiB activator)
VEVSFPAAALPLLLLLSAAPEKSADAERQDDLARLRSRIQTLQGQLEESRRRQATLSEELSRLELRLEIAAQEKELLARLREDYGERLEEITRERQSAEAAALESRRALLARARLLHRFGRFGYLRVLLEAPDASGFLRGIARLDSLARRDARLLNQHRGAQTRLEAGLAREKALKSETDRLYAATRREEQRIASLKSERESLFDRQRAESASRRREVATLSDKAARLEGLLERLARSSDAHVGPGGGIRPWKGVLDWPARGAVVETFGRHRHPRFDAWTLSNGISVAVPAGTPVRAVFSGKAVYAQWLAEYGNLVILDHGDGVFTLYAWLQAISVRPGTYVPAGTSIGVAGTGPGREEPGLYFEVRDRQKATDPVAWLR